MKYKPEELKKKIKENLSDLQFDEGKLDLFCCSVCEELNPSDSKINTSLQIEKNILDISNQSQASSKEEKELYAGFLQLTQAYLSTYKQAKDAMTWGKLCFFLDGASQQYHTERGELSEIIDNNGCTHFEWTWPHITDDPENGILPFKERMNLLEESLEVLIDVLNIELEDGIPSNKGRPKSNYHQGLIARVAALIDCILDIRIKKVNNDTDKFALLMPVCIRFMQNKVDKTEINNRRTVSQCFDDYLTLENMAFVYKKHDRLDLYINHVLLTKYSAEIEKLFHDSWQDWEKPYNFHMLSNRTKIA